MYANGVKTFRKLTNFKDISFVTFPHLSIYIHMLTLTKFGLNLYNKARLKLQLSGSTASLL